jgi:hypothetical protein
VERAKNSNKNKKLDPTWKNPMGQSKEDEVQAASKAFKNKYGAKDSWHGMTLAELAKRPGVDMEGDYVSAYSTFCMFTHPSYTAKHAYSSVEHGLSWSPIDSHLLELTCSAIGNVLKLVETYRAVHGIESADLDNVINEINFNLLARDRRKETEGIRPVVELGKWVILPELFLEQNTTC